MDDLDSGTVTFHLTAPDPDFLYKLALPMADAVPAGTPLHARLPLPATGPYEIASYDAKRSVIRLVRNPRFRLWSAAAQPDGFPDQIVERYGYTGESAVHAVERGTADITADGPDQTWPPALTSTLRTRYSSRLYHAPATGTVAVWLNTRLPPFDDLRVRRALNYAVDRNHLIELAGGPDVAQVGCQVLPPNSDGYRRYCPYTLDPNPAGTYRRARPDYGTAARGGIRHEGESPSPSGSTTSPSAGGTAPTSSPCSEASATRRSSGPSRTPVRPGVRTGKPASAAGTEDYPSPNNFFSTLFTCRSYDPARPNENLNVAGFCNRRIDAEIARAARPPGERPARCVATLEHDRPRDHRPGALGRDPHAAGAGLRLPPDWQLHLLLFVGHHRLGRRVPRPALGALRRSTSSSPVAPSHKRLKYPRCAAAIHPSTISDGRSAPSRPRSSHVDAANGVRSGQPGQAGRIRRRRAPLGGLRTGLSEEAAFAPRRLHDYCTGPAGLQPVVAGNRRFARQRNACSGQ